MPPNAWGKSLPLKQIIGSDTAAVHITVPLQINRAVTGVLGMDRSQKTGTHDAIALRRRDQTTRTAASGRPKSGTPSHRFPGPWGKLD